MIDAVRQTLSTFVHIFDKRVDGNLVPDYYAVVKKPMDLGTLKSRLQNGEYHTPQDFAEVRIYLLRV